MPPLWKLPSLWNEAAALFAAASVLGASPAGAHEGVSDLTNEVRPADGSALDEGELARDIAHLQAEWAKKAQVVRATPKLLQRGDRYPLLLPPSTLDEAEGCVTVVAVGTRNISFVLWAGREAGGNRAWPSSSQVGVAEVSRCGTRKALLQGLSVQMRSPRGVVEFLVAKSVEPLPLVPSLLPTRDPGALRSAPSVGPRPALPPSAVRAEMFERRARRERAAYITHRRGLSDRSGQGEVLLRLEPGCHRIAVLAESSGPSNVDLDAKLVDGDTGEVIFDDESEGGQAAFDWCVGRRMPARVNFVGAPSNASVLATIASWPLPVHLPPSWGAEARGRLAQALGTVSLGFLREGPVYTSLGVQGATYLPWEPEPLACYTVAVAALRGTITSLSVGVFSGGARRENHTSRGGRGTALSFCAGARAQGSIEVQASGLGVAWVLGVWRTSSTQGEEHTAEAKVPVHSTQEGRGQRAGL